MDEHAVDPVSVHVDDFETVPFSFEDVTGARNTAEYRDRKTAQCVVVLTLRTGEQMLRLEQVLDCIYLESTIDQPTRLPFGRPMAHHPVRAATRPRWRRRRPSC